MTPLIRIGLGWMAGIALARWFDPPWGVVAVLALPAIGALWLYRSRPPVRWGAVVALAALAGAWRLQFFQPTFDQNHVAFYNDRPGPVTITGLVADEPDVRDNYTNLRLRVDAIELAGVARPVNGLVLVRAPRFPEYVYGDHLAVRGQLETPPIFEDFSYQDYLARFGIFSLIRRPQVERLESDQGNPLWAAMLAFKRRASQSINHILEEPYASLLNGILLGIETGIPRRLYEAFNLTGTSHVIVISGSNISLVAGILLLLGQKAFGKRFAPPLAMAGILIYTFLVGADAAVSRAAAMGLIWVVSIWISKLIQARCPSLGRYCSVYHQNPTIL
ncbi:MAG: ComEC family competence protein [Chloroflexota bacterium]